MNEERIKARLKSGEYVIVNNEVVCSECHGNCGQCGYTGDIGSPPPQMQALIDSMYKSNEHINKTPISEENIDFLVILGILAILVIISIALQLLFGGC